MSAICSPVRIYRVIIALAIAMAGLGAVPIVVAQPIGPREVRAPRTVYAPRAICHVPADQTSIGGCIGTVPIGGEGTVMIAAGIYTENLIIENKAISLIGAGRDTTIVHSAAAGEPVLELQGPIISNSVIITGLTFENGDIATGGGCDAINNRPQDCGGGLLIWDSAVPVLENLRFRNNHAGLYGGGIYIAGNIPVTLTNVEVISNSAYAGGGLYSAFGTANSPVVVNGSRFISNTATTNGGGVYLENQLTINASQFSGNLAVHGGGAYVGGLTPPTLIITASQFTANQAGLNGQGGAIRTGGALIITASDFFSNTTGQSGWGAGVYAVGSTTLVNGQFVNNRGSNGGAVYGGGALILTGTHFISNSADFGAGLYVAGVGNKSVANARFERNAASIGSGLYAFAALEITGTMFISNRAEYEGGGAYLQGQIKLQNSHFINNRVTFAYGLGGGVSILNAQGDVGITATRFVSNFADYGGGLYLKDGYAANFRVVNSIFARNTVTTTGAAIAIDTHRMLTSYHTSLIHLSVADATLNARPAIAVINASTGRVYVTNTIVASHSVGLSQTLGKVSEDYNLYFANTVTQSGTITRGAHSLIGDPAFSDSANDDYHLGAASLAIDRGTLTNIPIDLEGRSRDATPDIGAYEVPPTPISGLAAANSSPTDLGSPTTFTATVSAGTSISYVWNFGDGTPIGTGANVTHTYTSVGTYTAIVTATNTANSQSATTLVTITNVPISGLVASNNSPTLIGQATALQATISTGTNVNYAWNFGDGTPLGSGANVTHTYASVGTYTALVTATNSLNTLTAGTLVTITNVPISGLVASNNSPTLIGQATALQATIVTGTNVSYVWNFGDGTPTATGASVTHTYLSVGNFTALVTATNSANALTASTLVTITNVPISGLVASNDSPTLIGQATSLQATISTGTNVNYVWNFGDGAPIGTGASVTHTYASVGTYTAIVTATNTANSISASTLVTITNVPISGLVASNDSPTLIGQATALQATIVTGTNVSYVWHFGDGTPTATGASVTHTYLSVGNFTALVTATNSVNALTASTLVTITNMPISGLVASNDSPTLIGQTTALQATISTGTNVSYAWNFGDGTPLGSGANVTHTYASVGTYTALVTATNSLNTLTATTTISITPSEIAISGLSAANSSPTVLGNSTAFTATTATGSSVQYTWNFGDGTPTQSGSHVAHTYANLGHFTALVTATNSLGSVNAATPVTITDVPISGLSAANSSPTALGQATQFTATINAGSNVTYAWNFGDGSALTVGRIVSHTYATPNTFTATVTAFNPASTSFATTLVTITAVPISGLSAANSSPTALGQTTQFTATIAAGANVAYEWNFGDGTPTKVGATITHTYGHAGSFTAIVTATNPVNALSASTLVTITPMYHLYLPLVVRQ